MKKDKLLHALLTSIFYLIPIIPLNLNDQTLYVTKCHSVYTTTGDVLLNAVALTLLFGWAYSSYSLSKHIISKLK